MSRFASVVLAPNPSPMTLEGTNTYLLRPSGATGCAVVDPGPDDERHVAAVLAAAGRVEAILLTHRHGDHSAAVSTLRDATGAPVYEDLDDGTELDLAGVRVRVLATPGHTADSRCLRLPDAVLTGDTILGRGTTVLGPEPTALADYLASLRRLAALGPVEVLPGHGPALPDLAAVAGQYLRHREDRLAEVRRARADLGTDDPAALVETIYADVDPVLWPAAQRSVRAALDYLREHG